ncbi:MAG: hypothetical protein RCG15_03245 [Candidatus Rickettsia vulgarisii]
MDQNAGLIGNINKTANYISKEIVPINPVTKHSMKENYGIGKIIEEDIIESRLSANNMITNKQVNKNNVQRIDLSSSNNSNRIVNSQKWGNCSTRSIRELLRDNILEFVFHDFYQYITDTPYSEMLKNAGIEYSPNQQDVLNKEELENIQNHIKALENENKILYENLKNSSITIEESIVINKEIIKNYSLLHDLRQKEHDNNIKLVMKTELQQQNKKLLDQRPKWQ